MIKRVEGFLEQIQGKRVAVIGNMAIDNIRLTQAYKVSNEEPCLICYDQGNVYYLGNAANVVANIRSMGGIPYPVAVIGTDFYGDMLVKMFTERGIPTQYLIRDSSRITSGYEKICAEPINDHGRRNQILRVDTPQQGDISEDQEKKIMSYLEELRSTLDAIIVSDYKKGIPTDSMITSIASFGRKYSIPTVGDSRDRVNMFKKFFVICPNDSESTNAIGCSVTSDNIEKAGVELYKSLGLDSMVIKKGENGISVYNNGTRHFPALTPPELVVDVTGCGDTVTATYGLVLGSGLDEHCAAELSQISAAVVVRKTGTSTASPEEMINLLRSTEKVLER